jgi:hypothetical protein
VSNHSGGALRGALSITYGFPPAAFLYQRTRPRLRVDGVDVPVPGWGTHRVPVAPGPRTVEVWVPYVLPRRAGKARAKVTVPAGQDVSLAYLAPAVTFLGGSLGAPGQQKSAGYSTVMTLNVVAIATVLVLIILAVLLR